MNIVTSDCKDHMRLIVEGRVDTVTSPQLQQAILNAFQLRNDVVVDFVNVPIISSAGLRALLIGQKTAESKGGTMKLVNVNESVFDVLKMTGFHKILMME